MNGLDIIIRDNLRWHARALVAADQHGTSKESKAILDAAPALDYPEPSDEWRIFAAEYERADAERRATRGLSTTRVARGISTVMWFNRAL